MRRILALCLTFHWTVVFALLSFGTIRGIGQPTSPVLAMLGLERTGESLLLGGRILPALLAVMLSLAAALFLWAFLTTIADASDGGAAAESATRIAFAAAIALVTFAVAALALLPLEGQLVATAIFCAALLASYVAINTERLVAPEAEDVVAPLATDLARLVAQDAGKFASMPQSGVVYPFPRKER
jgi:hypothetical protein